jgi:hydroxylamine reductase
MGVCGKNEDIQSLQDILLFGLKGIAAYAHHARELGMRDEEVDAFMHEALFKTITNVDFDLDHHIKIVLEAGRINLKVMELLDKAHTARYGNPVPTEVDTGTRKGPGILVTGHDLLHLEELLKQTEGTGINIYTHSEMLPAHGYPGLKKYKHLAGNYGGAWQDQKKEFKEFGGAILVTTNCVLIPPANTYLDRLFTAGPAGVPGAKHIDGLDFSAVIAKAEALGPLEEKPGKKIMTGFHHTAVLSVADKMIAAVKAGKIKRFFLIGGCDGAKSGRNYYTEFAEGLPKDTVILTLACGKYRFIKHDFGSIDGIPRLLDVGQCNNAYSAVQIAVALSKAFNCSVNDLPLSFVLSWFEQKAVAILLTLLYLGIKDIRLGPTLPAFVSKNVLDVLVKQFGIKPVTTAAADMKAALAGK